MCLQIAAAAEILTHHRSLTGTDKHKRASHPVSSFQKDAEHPG